MEVVDDGEKDPSCLFCKKTKEIIVNRKRYPLIISNRDVYKNMFVIAAKTTDDFWIEKLDSILKSGILPYYHRQCWVRMYSKWQKKAVFLSSDPSELSLSRQLYDSAFQDVKLVVEEEIISNRKFSFFDYVR